MFRFGTYFVIFEVGYKLDNAHLYFSRRFSLIEIKLSIIILFSLLCICPCHADSWPEPDSKTFYSENGMLFLKVIPGKPELKEQSGGHSKDTVDSFSANAVGILFKKNKKGKVIEVWRERLANPEMPVRILISGNGKYVATFDDWGKMGYGKNVIVVYNEKGKMLYRYSLEDILTKEELSKVSQSLSSLEWTRPMERHSFAKDGDSLVLKTVNNKSLDLKTGKISLLK